MNDPVLNENGHPAIRMAVLDASVPQAFEALVFRFVGPVSCPFFSFSSIGYLSTIFASNTTMICYLLVFIVPAVHRSVLTRFRQMLRKVYQP